MVRTTKSKLDSPIFQEIALKEINEVENKILSSIYFYYEEIKETIDIESTPIDFFITPIARKLFEVLQKSKRNKEIGYELVEVIATLKTLCKDATELEECERYLSNLSKEFQYYTIKDNWNRLKAYSIKAKVNAIAKEIMDTPMNYQLIDDQVINWQNKMNSISLSLGITKLKTMDEIIDEWIKYIEKSLQESKIEFLKTRYDELDKKIKNLSPGQLIILASRPGIGKTTFALNLLHRNLKYLNKTNVENPWGMGMFSLEMTNMSLVEKMIAICSFCPLSTIEKLKDGKGIEEWEQTLIDGARAQLTNTNIFLCDDSNITLGSLISNIRKAVANNNLKVVIIDYLQLINMPEDESKRYSTTYQYQKIGMISRTLKLLALELNICIIALAQLNRKIEERVTKDKSPLLSDLRESGSLEQDADIVMFLYEEEIKKGSGEKSTLLKIGKNRNGATGTIEFFFDKEKGIYKCIGEVYN